MNHFQFSSLIINIFLATSISALTNQQFSYSVQDINVIPYGQWLQISNSIISTFYEFTSDGEIKINQTFTQAMPSNQSLVEYNILFFNLDNSTGRKCYYDYFINLQPQSIAEEDCSNIINLTSSNSSITCINFTSCTSQSYSYEIYLKSIQYLQHIVIIENNNTNNFNESTLNLVMESTVEVFNSNQWFYWSVALTCFLLLSLVLLTGIVLYWSLKYTKAKRALEELRLTEADEADSIRKSIRKNLKQK